MVPSTQWEDALSNAAVLNLKAKNRSIPKRAQDYRLSKRVLPA